MIKVQLSTLSPTTDVLTAFPEWIIQYCNLNSRVLDVGAGRDINKTGSLIRPHIARLVGVDPSENIKHNPVVDEGYKASLEEFAHGHLTKFDSLYAMFVIEHVANPYAFLSGCRSLLKPNGMLFGVTPNLWHYLGVSAKISTSMGIEDWLLERLVGKQSKEDYHFPTTYRMNSIRAISRALEQTGFQAVEFRCFDPTRRLEFYFPPMLKRLPSVYTRLVYLLHLSRFMGYLMFRATAD
jgi:SAM-dependent methyltransferase